jgi:diadenylate cyclase
MADFSSILSRLPTFGFAAVVDVLIVAFLIYQTFLIVRGRRAAPILAGVVFLITAYFVAMLTGLELLGAILSYVVPYSAIAIIVLFQSDIRRGLAQLGRTRWFHVRSRYLDRESIGEILLALSRLSQERTGAIVVIERGIGLRTFIESGVSLNAQLTVPLLISIFMKNSPLHDGAVIVQGGKIAAASCFLPLSINPNLSRMLGTRHRAAIGVTEESDALSIVVSEETGRISLASFGDIEMDVTLERVEEVLLQNARQTIDPVRKVSGLAHHHAHAPGMRSARRELEPDEVETK